MTYIDLHKKMVRRKVFKEMSNSSQIDNLIISESGFDRINIQVTCSRDGCLYFTKKRAKSIAKYLEELSNE